MLKHFEQREKVMKLFKDYSKIISEANNTK